jgi:hypothetical protein
VCVGLSADTASSFRASTSAKSLSCGKVHFVTNGAVDPGSYRLSYL